MPRLKATTAEVDERIKALALANATVGDIARQLNAEGFDVPSNTTIKRRVAKVRGPRRASASVTPMGARRKPRSKKKKTRAKADDADSETGEHASVTGEEQRALLSALLRGVVKDARESRKEGDSASAAAHARVATALSASISRIPIEVPPVDHRG